MNKNFIKLLVMIGLFIFQIEISNADDIFNIIQTGTIDEIKSYLKAGGAVNAADKNGMTLLMWAACVRDADIVKLLIDAKADVNKSNKGMTALILGAASSKADVVELLINAHADVNAKNVQGYTALIIAASKGNIDIVRLLINAKADLNIKDNQGQTALQWATKNGYSEIALLLTTYTEKDNTFIKLKKFQKEGNLWYIVDENGKMDYGYYLFKTVSQSYSSNTTLITDRIIDNTKLPYFGKADLNLVYNMITSYKGITSYATYFSACFVLSGILFGCGGGLEYYYYNNNYVNTEGYKVPPGLWIGLLGGIGGAFGVSTICTLVYMIIDIYKYNKYQKKIINSLNNNGLSRKSNWSDLIDIKFDIRFDMQKKEY